MKQPLLADCCCLVLLLLFAYTGWSKLADYSTFYGSLRHAPLLKAGASTIARTLPPVELAVALLLVLPRTRRAGLWASLLLLSLFTVYLGYMLLTSRHLPCSCGGVLPRLSWGPHLGLNLLLLAAATTGLRALRKTSTPKLSLQHTSLLQ